VYLDDLDYQLYLRLLGQTTRRFEWQVLAYCLMPNHVHLLVRVLEPTLSAGMHRQQGLYARRYNERHNYSGHVFEARFHSVHVTREEQLFLTLRYLALNPPQAGLCVDPADWPWSSHAVLAGRSRDWSPLHVLSIRELFGAGHQWLARYARFIDGPAAAEP
jgi:REP element-mobilizing transposase RayT